MAKEYLAAKNPGGRRIHIWDDDASFDEYIYDRELVEKDPVPANNAPVKKESHKERTVDEINAHIDELLGKLEAMSTKYNALISRSEAMLSELEAR